jgi:hypothetical protein
VFGNLEPVTKLTLSAWVSVIVVTVGCHVLAIVTHFQDFPFVQQLV